MMTLYIAEAYGKVKIGFSGTPKSRITSYTRGNNDASIRHFYVSVNGYDEHVKNCENYSKRQLFPYLENPHSSHTPSEYVDTKFPNVNFDYVRDVVEDRIKTHPLRIKRVKKAFLPITRYNIKTVMDGIKNFPDKYLEDVS